MTTLCRAKISLFQIAIGKINTPQNGSIKSGRIEIAFRKIDIGRLNRNKIGSEKLRTEKGTFRKSSVAENGVLRLNFAKRAVFKASILKKIGKKTTTVETAIDEDRLSKRAGVNLFSAEIFITKSQHREVSVFPHFFAAKIEASRFCHRIDNRLRKMANALRLVVGARIFTAVRATDPFIKHRVIISFTEADCQFFFEKRLTVRSVSGNLEV